jgi:hypothetical protein
MGLQQGFTTGEMGADRYFAWQQSSGSNIRFGSKADIPAPQINVRFTPNSGHRNSVEECTAANNQQSRTNADGFLPRVGAG